MFDWQQYLARAAANPMFTQAMGAAPGGPSLATRLAGANSALTGAGITAGSVANLPVPPPVTPATGLLGGTPTYLSQRLAGNPTTGLGLKSLSPGSLGRAGLYGIGGQLAGAGVEAAFGDPNQSWDNALASGLRWGGAGAALGSMVAPGIGTAVGGALGGGIGAIKGLVNARDEGTKAVASELSKQSNTLASVLTKAGTSADLREQVLMQLQLGAMDATNKGQVRAAAANLRTQLPDAIMADRAQQKQERTQQANQAAAQAWMAPMLAQALQKSQYYADQYSNAGQSAANQISDPALRAAQRSMAAGISSDQAGSNAAYAAQVAAAPGYWGYQNNILDLIRQAQQQLQSSPTGQNAWSQIMAQAG